MMNNEEFLEMYDDYLQHGWVTSKIAAIAARQKERERQYNRDYYRKHSRRFRERVYGTDKIDSAYDKLQKSFVKDASTAEQLSRERSSSKRRYVRLAQKDLKKGPYLNKLNKLLLKINEVKDARGYANHLQTLKLTSNIKSQLSKLKKMPATKKRDYAIDLIQKYLNISKDVLPDAQRYYMNR